jgi:hypothetical protein
MLVLPFVWESDAENTSLTEAQDRSPVLNAIGGAALRWLMSDEGKRVAKCGGKQHATLRAKWAKHLRTVRKDMVNLNRVASNLAGNETAWRVALQCPAMEPTLRLFNDEYERGLIEVAGNMANYTAQSFEANRYLEALRALVASGQAAFTSIYSNAPIPERTTKLGWEDDNGFYLIPEIAYKEACKLLSEGGGFNHVGKNTIHKQLGQIGALASTGKDGQTVVKRVEGKLQRVLHIKPEIFDEKSDE